MKGCFVIILNLLFFFQGTSQELIGTLKGEFDLFTTDRLGNVYAVQGDELLKYNKKGKVQYRFSEKDLGRISGVNVSSSLKPVVFYQEVARFLVLDNTLSVQGSPMALQDYGLDQASLMCTSVNDHFWFYDSRSLELVRASRTFREIERSGNLARALGMDLQPKKMIEFNSKLYFCSPPQGILIFDIYGSYLKTLPLENVKDFQVTDGTILYQNEEGIHLYYLKSFRQETIDLPVENPDGVRLAGNLLYLRNEEGIQVYEYDRFPPEKNR